MSANSTQKPTTEELKQYASLYTTKVKTEADASAFRRQNATDSKWGPIMRYVEEHLGTTKELAGLSAEELGILHDLRLAQVQVAQASKQSDAAIKVAQKRADNTQEAAQVLATTAKTQADAQQIAEQSKGSTGTTPPKTTSGTPSTPTFGTPTDPTSFQATFLSDAGIQDLARSGEFDIGPKEIAALMPTAAAQQAATSTTQGGTGTGTSVVDQLQPEQYKNSDFVHVGGGFALPDTKSMQKNQITDADLPDWEKKVLMNQVDTQSPATGPMTQQEYEAARAAILNQTGHRQGPPQPGFLTGIRNDVLKTADLTQTNDKLQQLARQYQAQKSNTAGNASLRDIIAKPYGMTASEVASSAVQLFKAGYLTVPNYDPTKKLSDQMSITSAFDPNFQKAWNAWVSDSFKDRSKTMMDILQEKQTDFMGQLQLMAKAVSEANAKKNQIQLTDSASIRKTSDQLAQSQIGRSLTDVEHQQLVGYIHNLETASQQAVISGSSTIENVDPQARLSEEIDATHPVESQATSEADQYNNFRQLIAGPRGVV